MEMKPPVDRMRIAGRPEGLPRLAALVDQDRTNALVDLTWVERPACSASPPRGALASDRLLLLCLGVFAGGSDVHDRFAQRVAVPELAQRSRNLGQ